MADGSYTSLRAVNDAHQGPQTRASATGYPARPCARWTQNDQAPGASWRSTPPTSKGTQYLSTAAACD